MNGFDRRSIINAHALYALYRGIRVRDSIPPRAWSLCDVRDPYSHSRRGPRGSRGAVIDALDSLEFEDVVCFFALIHTKLAGVAATLADDYSRAHAVDGVKIHIDNEGDDPCMITFIIRDPIADAWANRHGSLAGGTWECPDGDETFVYDTTVWHPKLIEELQAEGFDLDQSDYVEPDEDDILASEHACSGCEICGSSVEKAREHLVDAEPLEQVAHLALNDKP